MCHMLHRHCGSRQSEHGRTQGANPAKSKLASWTWSQLLHELGELAEELQRTQILILVLQQSLTSHAEIVECCRHANRQARSLPDVKEPSFPSPMQQSLKARRPYFQAHVLLPFAELGSRIHIFRSPASVPLTCLRREARVMGVFFGFRQLSDL